ncbi:MmgE/PrpD family protein [Nakamurella flavida]|uniref:MmgE/PrpD family protein n=1 Tax=Nakamurella flavida TaxID=363630 RepID=A0A938YHR8_9ACTN|nr:MmgE/PrpD family protein [Nakamurella flavida]MBM9475329.1 MmgE/PrpD family protein [Nakamurella flavida]MDP9776903.1 2-methylcitrate dehydratase PrpD [Nakamurella flavida]
MTTVLDEVLPTLVTTAADVGERSRSDAALGEISRRLLARSVAGAIAGGADPAVSALTTIAGAGDHPLLTGGAPVATPAAAAGIHAAAVTVGQCDDGLREAAGHPGLHAFGAAWSVGLTVDAALGDVLAAFATGWEAGARLGLLLGRPRTGIHPHGGWGTAAAAVATATILGGDLQAQEAAARAALSVALTGPDSTLVAGASTHYLLPALGTANGVTVGLLGLDLADTPVDAVSHFASVAHPRAAAAGGPDTPLLLQAYLKPLGLCAHTLTAWQVADDLRREGGADRVVGTHVRTYRAAAALAGSHGRTVLARRFSVPWAVAYGLSGRRPGPDDGDLAALAASVLIDHAPELDDGYPRGRPTRVDFHFDDGRTVARQAVVHLGDRERPLSDRAEIDVCAALLADGGRADLRAWLDELRRAPGDTPIRTLASRVSGDRTTTPDLEGRR